jgi:hypothetical protein
MTNPQSPLGVPIAAAAGQAGDDAEPEPTGPVVGASDAEADAARSGADADLSAGSTERDSDGVPVGEADAEEDRRQSGG